MNMKSILLSFVEIKRKISGDHTNTYSKHCVRYVNLEVASIVCKSMYLIQSRYLDRRCAVAAVVVVAVVNSFVFVHYRLHWHWWPLCHSHSAADAATMGWRPMPFRAIVVVHRRRHLAALDRNRSTSGARWIADSGWTVNRCRWIGFLAVAATWCALMCWVGHRVWVEALAAEGQLAMGLWMIAIEVEVPGPCCAAHRLQRYGFCYLPNLIVL